MYALCWIRIYKSVPTQYWNAHGLHTKSVLWCIMLHFPSITSHFRSSFYLTHTHTLIERVIKSTRSRYFFSFFCSFYFFNSLWFCVRIIFVYLISSQMHTYFITHTNHTKRTAQCQSRAVEWRRTKSHNCYNVSPALPMKTMATIMALHSRNISVYSVLLWI